MITGSCLSSTTQPTSDENGNTIFIKTSTLSSNPNSFFTKCANIANYVFRHKIISGFQKSDKTLAKLTSRFCLKNRKKATLYF